MVKEFLRKQAKTARSDLSRQPVWRLRLYVHRESPLTPGAVDSVRAICDAYAADNHELEIIDLDEQPERADDEQIIALPTLVCLWPEPVRRLVGDLSDQERVVVALNMSAAAE